MRYLCRRHSQSKLVQNTNDVYNSRKNISYNSTQTKYFIRKAYNTFKAYSQH